MASPNWPRRVFTGIGAIAVVWLIVYLIAGFNRRNWKPAKPVSQSATAPTAGRASGDSSQMLMNVEMECPDLSGALSVNLKVRAEAKTWNELVAKVKPTFTWGQPECTQDVQADCGFPDMMWIDQPAGDKPVFRLARAVTWKPFGQKARWVILDLDLDSASQHQDDLLGDQIQGRALPDRVEVANERPAYEHPASYAVVRGAHPRGGIVYEIGWALEMCYGTGHYEPLRLLYVWRDGGGNWRFLGEGPGETQGHDGYTRCEATIRWASAPLRPAVSFIVFGSESESRENQPDLPDLTICHDAALDALGGPLPARLTRSQRGYILAEKDDTLDKIAYRMVVRGNEWDAYGPKPTQALLHKRQEVLRKQREDLLKLNPQLSRNGSAAIPQRTRIEIEEETPARKSGG